MDEIEKKLLEEIDLECFGSLPEEHKDKCYKILTAKLERHRQIKKEILERLENKIKEGKGEVRLKYIIEELKEEIQNEETYKDKNLKLKNKSFMNIWEKDKIWDKEF